MSISPLTKKAKLRLHSVDDFLAVSGVVNKCLEIGLHSNPLRELTSVNPNLARFVWYQERLGTCKNCVTCVSQIGDTKAYPELEKSRKFMTHLIVF